MLMSLLNAPSVKRVVDCSEFAIKDDNCETAGGPSTQRTVLSSQSSLSSSSNDIKDGGNMELIKAVESIKVNDDFVSVELDVSPCM